MHELKMQKIISKQQLTCNYDCIFLGKKNNSKQYFKLFLACNLILYYTVCYKI